MTLNEQRKINEKLYVIGALEDSGYNQNTIDTIMESYDGDGKKMTIDEFNEFIDSITSEDNSDGE